ncbi:putative ribosome-binding factor A [Hibiscus syriacus]|uniref:Ribosome-binding factor A n=1 Tax=Hibiscus syriacus TaxID=106335 RepID=A0A6A2ZF30_HIBSY|nr:putative ribosome-binding factor A [Hibiscus syriacus]
MANPRRVKMIAKQIRRGLSDMLLTDKVVKVYVSVFDDERGKDIAVAGLKSKAKYVRSELGRRMKLRLTPEIRFIEDVSLERGSRVISILDKIEEEKKTAADDEEVESI